MKPKTFSSASKKRFLNIQEQRTYTNSDSVIYLTVYNYISSYYWWSVV